MGRRFPPLVLPNHLLCVYAVRWLVWARWCPLGRLHADDVKKLALFSRIQEQLFLTPAQMTALYKSFVTIPTSCKTGASHSLSAPPPHTHTHYSLHTRLVCQCTLASSLRQDPWEANTRALPQALASWA